MKKIVMLAAMFLALAGLQAHAAAVGSRGGKKVIGRTLDANGQPMMFNNDKPWKIFESTQSNVVLLVDESGVAPKQGMINKVCVSTDAASTWTILYDSNTTSGLSFTSTGVRMIPPIAGSTSLTQCFEVNAMFTSGCVIERNANAGNTSGSYVYWRELSGNR